MKRLSNLMIEVAMGMCFMACGDIDIRHWWLWIPVGVGGYALLGWRIRIASDSGAAAKG